MTLLKLFTYLLLLTAAKCIKHNNQKQGPPTVYEYYEGSGRESGLTAEEDGFKLNGKPIRIISGAMHYFRIHPDYWRDRMKRLRASGANTLETYVPWNLHEPEMGYYDFGNGTKDFSAFLDVRRYIEMAREEDLLVIFRPGPYICSEWDFGGLPSWLSSIPGMKVRSSNSAYEDRVKLYFDLLLPWVNDLQWSHGGPIIMYQIENEYGGFGTEDIPHLEYLKMLMENNGVRELFMTSDSPLTNRDTGAIPGVLQTANFQVGPELQLNTLLSLQPNKPILVTEYWSGWFDHWLEPTHQTTTPQMFANILETIFDTYNGSVNYYMFHGGTNFGFMAGANWAILFPFYEADVTSYDYDAPLSESGNYTEKYRLLRELNIQYSPVELSLPEMIPPNPTTSYGEIDLQTFLDYEDIIDRVPSSHRVHSNITLSMENLPINRNCGQSYGYIVYRSRYYVGNNTKIKIGRARDLASVVVDGKLQSNPLSNVSELSTGFGYWIRAEQELTLNLDLFVERNVDLVVENMGRVNFGGPAVFEIKKGLNEGPIFIDGDEITNLEVIALEFKNDWVKSLTGLRNITDLSSINAPALFQSAFTITGVPADTWIDMSSWHKGIVFVNGFNIGRYFKVGPQQALYVPAPLLATGINTVTIFEQFSRGSKIVFSDHPMLG